MVNKKKEDILVAANSLFMRNGFHVVGVDWIIQESNVAKMTFYRHFPSKEELIRSVLIRRNESLQDSIKNFVALQDEPIAKLKSVFDWYKDWFLSDDFYGCMFIRASEEFRDANCPIRNIAREYKTWFEDYINSLLEGIEVSNSREIAKHIVIILEGLTVKANMYNSTPEDELDFSWKYSMGIICRNGVSPEKLLEAC